jgi:hypothetical protein
LENSFIHLVIDFVLYAFVVFHILVFELFWAQHNWAAFSRAIPYLINDYVPMT